MNTKAETIVVTGTFVSELGAHLAYRKLARALDADVVTLNRFGFAHTRISVEKVIRRIEAVGAPVNLVGHSQGGLVAAIIEQERPELVATAFALGAPLHGTALCNSLLPLSGLRCMARGARLTSTLHAGSNLHCVVGTADHLVVPYASGLLEGAHHHVFAGLGHLGLILDDQVIDLIRGEVAAKPTRPARRQRVAA